jgi:hypothetical protein
MPNEEYINKNASDEHLFFWFTNMVSCQLNNISKLTQENNSYLQIIKFNNEFLNDPMYLAKEKYREIHYDKLRQISELYYNIRVYLPIIPNNCKKQMDGFKIANYEKIQELYSELYLCYFNKLLYPKTNDEKRIVQILLEELRHMEDMLIPRLPKKYKANHFIRTLTEEPYRIMKSKNHILFVYEDELYKTLKEEEPIKIMKSTNHILFMYNE